jgi:hypothetical protein
LVETCLCCRTGIFAPAATVSVRAERAHPSGDGRYRRLEGERIPEQYVGGGAEAGRDGPA